MKRRLLHTFKGCAVELVCQDAIYSSQWVSEVSQLYQHAPCQTGLEEGSLSSTSVVCALKMTAAERAVLFPSNCFLLCNCNLTVMTKVSDSVFICWQDQLQHFQSYVLRREEASRK